MFQSLFVNEANIFRRNHFGRHRFDCDTESTAATNGPVTQTWIRRRNTINLIFTYTTDKTRVIAVKPARADRYSLSSNQRKVEVLVATVNVTARGSTRYGKFGFG